MATGWGTRPGSAQPWDTGSVSRSAGHTLVWPHWVTGNGDTSSIMVHHAITSSIMVQVPPVVQCCLCWVQCCPCLQCLHAGTMTGAGPQMRASAHSSVQFLQRFIQLPIVNNFIKNLLRLCMSHPNGKVVSSSTYMYCLNKEIIMQACPFQFYSRIKSL